MPVPDDAQPTSPDRSSHPQSGQEEWARQRRQAAGERARLLRRRQQAEQARASRIISLFVAVARAGGLACVPLRVKGRGGGSARTGLHGWYLRPDHTVGIDVDGGFYVLSRSLTLRERLCGVRPHADPPPMTLGEGGRDGDTIPLRFALNQLLPGWEERSAEPLA